MSSPSSDELLRTCERSAVHLEMRDGYSRTDPMFTRWQAGYRDGVQWPARRVGFDYRILRFCFTGGRAIEIFALVLAIALAIMTIPGWLISRVSPGLALENE